MSGMRSIGAGGFERECEACSLTFKTRTNTSGAWQKLCEACYFEKQTSTSFRKLNRQVQSHIMSLEDRTKAMEDKFSNIELVVEVAAKDLVTDAIAKVLEEIKTSVLEEAKQIIEIHVKEQTEKWQMQLLKMNNRILTLTKEMGLDD